MISRKNRIVAVFVVGLLSGVATASYAQTDSTAPSARKVARKQNHQLEIKVRHALTSVKHLDSSGIVIVARGGDVTLDGDAPDDGQIQLAAATTSKVSGVTDVANNLRVREAGH